MNHELIGQLAKDKLIQLRTQAAIEQEIRSKQLSLLQGHLLASTKHKPRQVALRRRNP